MTPLNPLFAIIIFFIAFITAYLINLKYKIIYNKQRYETIDGLRGFLAVGVFIHHSAIWFQYLQINQWEEPKSNLFNQLGQTSVSLFFMITAFLFTSKLLNSDKIDWKKLFISRFFRIVPLYLATIIVIILIVFILSDWQIRVNIFYLLKQILNWVLFTLPGASAINNISFTNFINAGVTWTLTYEWFFYFSLPLLSILLIRKRPPTLFLGISISFTLYFLIFNHPNISHILSFVGGITPP